LAELPSIEQQVADMLAVLDTAGSERAAVVANGPGGSLAIFFAATYRSGPLRSCSTGALHG
jgi:hypothetical protein